MLNDRLRRLKRYKDIVSLIGKCGFGYVIEEVGLSNLLSLKERFTADLEREDTKSIGVRLRCLFEELGPTYIKLGQLLSIRSDILPAEVIRELETLQDDVPPVPYEVIKEKLEMELGQPVEKAFFSFNEICLAAASIGQVHEAILRTGERVVIKIQRPGIKETIFTDLEILMDLSRLIEQRYEWAKQNKLSEMVAELSDSIRRELDYLEEGRNTETIQMQFKESDPVQIPSIYWDYTTSEILTMDYVDGLKLTDIHNKIMDEAQKRRAADSLVEVFITQILREGFFHADPHPGNILYLSDTEKIGIIDFGQIGRLSKGMRYDVTSLMLGLITENTEMIVKSMYKLTDVPNDVDERKFYDDIDRISKRLSHSPLGDLDLGTTINELFATAQNHQIIIPKDFTLLGKTLITLEGIVTEIDPSSNLLQLAKPHGEKLIRERYHPANMTKRFMNEAEDISEALAKFPGKVDRVLDQTADGDLQVKISLSEISEIFNKIDRISNQVSFSLTLLAFSIVVLGLVVGATFGSNTFLTSIHALEIGFAIGFLMFIWIIYSIIKSGRF